MHTTVHHTEGKPTVYRGIGNAETLHPTVVPTTAVLCALQFEGGIDLWYLDVEQGEGTENRGSLPALQELRRYYADMYGEDSEGKILGQPMNYRLYSQYDTGKLSTLPSNAPAPA